METSDAMTVTVEFFGPFRVFGKNREVTLVGPVGYGELLSRLSADLGSDFAEHAARKSTTVIVNNRVASRRSLATLVIEPGDRVAFALLLGGG
ncbi:MAG TPA: MoaD/ThiS family protein [Candidatus Anoxymicrobiaceae bacterium]